MSFNDDYLELRKKRMRRQNAESVSVSNEDIAPVYTKSASDTDNEENKRTWFKADAFKDGYDFGDVTKTILTSGGDLLMNAVKGVANLGEGVTDLVQYGVAGAADLLGADDFAEIVKKGAQKQTVQANFRLQQAVQVLHRTYR